MWLNILLPCQNITILYVRLVNTRCRSSNPYTQKSHKVPLTLRQLHFLKLFICAEQIIHRDNFDHMTLVPVRPTQARGWVISQKVNCMYFLFIYFPRIVKRVQRRATSLFTRQTNWVTGQQGSNQSQIWGSQHWLLSICLELKPNVSTEATMCMYCERWNMMTLGKMASKWSSEAQLLAEKVVFTKRIMGCSIHPHFSLC